MKTLKHRIALIFCFASIICMGQKCKDFKKGIRKAKKHFPQEEIATATKSRYLFSKFSNAAITYLVRSDDSYYLAITLARELGRRIDLMDKDPLVIQLANNEIITLYAKKSSLGKFTLPVTTERNNQFYTITEEQLELLSSSTISHVKIYFTSDLVSENKYSVDDLGKFFDYEILNERYQKNLMEPALCMLKL